MAVGANMRRAIAMRVTVKMHSIVSGGGLERLQPGSGDGMTEHDSCARKEE